MRSDEKCLYSLAKIMLTLMDYFPPANRFTPWVTDQQWSKKKKVVASLMEVYGSPTVVRQKFAERFAGRDPPI
jgi:hypothetical protein